MNLKEYILQDLNKIKNPDLLYQCFEYIQTIKKLEQKNLIHKKY